MKSFTERNLELLKEAITHIWECMMYSNDIELNMKNYERILCDGIDVVVKYRKENAEVPIRPLNQLKPFEVLLIADEILKMKEAKTTEK